MAETEPSAEQTHGKNSSLIICETFIHNYFIPYKAGKLETGLWNVLTIQSSKDQFSIAGLYQGGVSWPK